MGLIIYGKTCGSKKIISVSLGGLYQNLPINATEIPQLACACDRTVHFVLLSWGDFEKNYQRLFKMRLPHMDTVDVWFHHVVPV
jgi:hypothetical protein